MSQLEQLARFRRRYRLDHPLPAENFADDHGEGEQYQVLMTLTVTRWKRQMHHVMQDL